MEKDKYIKIVFFALLVLCFKVQYSNAQSGSFGNTYIANGAELTIFGEHNFLNGGEGILPGIIGTARTAPIGYLSFLNSASWINASDNAYVDGYVKSYKNSFFTFPIGDNNVYAPVVVSGVSSEFPVSAAYFHVNPELATTSKVDGFGNEPALPEGAPFLGSALSEDIRKISTVEYWDIDGERPINISLSWNVKSDIGILTENQLCLLTIAGWNVNNQRWEMIESGVDVFSLIDGSESTLISGSITTKIAVIPNAYSVYTLASKYPMTLETVLKNVTCYGFTDGEIKLDVKNGTAPYTFIWNDGMTTSEIYGLPANNYDVVITDAALCRIDTMFTILQPEPLKIEGNFELCIGMTAQYTINDLRPELGYWKSTDENILTIDMNGFAIANSLGHVTIIYVNNNMGCETYFDVEVKSLPEATIFYSSQPLCTTGIAQVNQIGQEGGMYTSYPSGLSINNNTGAINLDESKEGTYTVTYIFDNGTCSNTVSTSLIVVPNTIPKIKIGIFSRENR